MNSRGQSATRRTDTGRTTQNQYRQRDGTSIGPYYKNPNENVNRNDGKYGHSSAISSKGFINSKPTNIGGSSVKHNGLANSQVQPQYSRAGANYSAQKPTYLGSSNILNRNSQGNSTDNRINRSSVRGVKSHQEGSIYPPSHGSGTLNNGTHVITGVIKKKEQPNNMDYAGSNQPNQYVPSSAQNRSTPSGNTRILADKTSSFQNTTSMNSYNYGGHQGISTPNKGYQASTEMFQKNANDVLNVNKNSSIYPQEKSQRIVGNNSNSQLANYSYRNKSNYDQVNEYQNQDPHPGHSSNIKQQIQSQGSNKQYEASSGKSAKDLLDSQNQKSNYSQSSSSYGQGLSNMQYNPYRNNSNPYSNPQKIGSSLVKENGAQNSIIKQNTEKQASYYEKSTYNEKSSGYQYQSEKDSYQEKQSSYYTELDERKTDRTKVITHKKFNSPSKHYENVTPRGLVGLRNIGNTCFMNSILQCLLNAPLFSEYFMAGNHKKERNPKAKGVADSFYDLLAKVRSHEGEGSSAENPSKFKSAIERFNSMFYGYDQHDAQELLKAALEAINDDVNRVTTKPKYKELTVDPRKSIQETSEEWFSYMLGRDNSIVTDLFCGQLQSKIICKVCGNESLAFDNFWDLSVSFPSSNKSKCHISQMFEEFLKEEVLDDLFKCEKCNKRTKSTKKFVIWRLPKILVIHLKRFAFGKYRREKINTAVQFPIDNLDLSDYVQEAGIKDPKYTLFGITNHSGSLSGGHYTAECMNPYNKKWYNFNDSWVRSSDVSDSKYSSSGGSSPYVLFYVKTSAYNQIL